MNRVRAIDPLNFTHHRRGRLHPRRRAASAAEQADRLFPLSLGAEGSCQIGGNLSTNAGGIAVLRYGNTRELMLGLEVGAARRPRARTALRSAAQGQYRLRPEAALHRRRRHARHHHRRDAEAVPAAARSRDRVSRRSTSVEDVMALFARARAATGDQLTAFELIPRIGARYGDAPRARHHRSAGAPHPWYVLLEVSSSQTRQRPARARSRTCSAKRSKPAWSRDGVIAESDDAGARSLAHPRGHGRGAELRGRQHQARRLRAGQPRSPNFIERATAAVEARLPGIRADRLRPCRRRQHPLQPEPAGRRRQGGLSGALAGVQPHRPRHRARSFDGSISAEHGIGRLEARRACAL